MKYRVVLRRINQQGKFEEKRPVIDATSPQDVMEIVQKAPENRGFYIWSIKEDESES